MACVRLYTIYTYILLTLGDIERVREGERERERETRASLTFIFSKSLEYSIFKVLDLIEIIKQVHVDKYFIENKLFVPKNSLIFNN